jgi:predicted DNA-binding antitoxin AbrB/MazE fold protein
MVPYSTDSAQDGDDMSTIKTYPKVRAIHHNGVLELLDTLDLPEGAQVRLSILSVLSSDAELVYPTRFVSAEKLNLLTGLAEIGGDALRESEALYDPDWD